MKIYFHLNVESFSNCYLVVNEKTKEALIIDPCKISKEIIDQIENDHYKLSGVLITHKHQSHTAGLATLKKIYDFNIYAADAEVCGEKNLLKGDGDIKVAGLTVSYYSLPGHTADSIVYKIGNAVFTGDVISAGKIGSSSCSYTHSRLCSGIKSKLFTMAESNLVFPGHGPLTSIGAEKLYNTEVGEKLPGNEPDSAGV
ncbi:MAG: MBL fold metallo-hydrolase [Treponema sp.]|nr:MBL fold metallo-hydrolase [Candidatus Treponema equifaecale]